MLVRNFTIIESRPWAGFFSNFLHTLQHLYRCEKNGRIPIVYWKGGCYSKKDHSNDNIWEYYFKPISEDCLNPEHDHDIYRTSRYRKDGLPEEPQYCWDYTRMPPSVGLNNPSAEGRIHVNRIIRSHIFIKDSVIDKVNTFFYKHMTDTKILSVHLRATKEDVQVQGIKPFSRFCRRIQKYINHYDKCKVFVATDCSKTLDKLRQKFGCRIIFYDSIRSTNTHPVHYGCYPEGQWQSAGPKAGEDALIDCLLLAKGDLMLHGFSNLSACAAYFNPKMSLKFTCKYKK